MATNFRHVTSYVTQMSLVKNCPAHIKGAYAATDIDVTQYVVDTDAEGVGPSAE
ncbi:MAG: hypothetical protein LC624_00920 [Halobacteriales archaeon]|nr:hypothetical protein [Halobacteriales archaeon]